MSRFGVAACIGLVLYLTVMPIVILVYGSLRSVPLWESGGVFTLRNYSNAYTDWEFYAVLWNSAKFAVGSGMLSFFIGTYLAWLVERTNVPMRRAFRIMAFIPLFTPGVIDTIAWIFLLSPKIGIVNVLLKEAFGLSGPVFNVFSMSGMIWVHAVNSYTLTFLLMSAAFRNMDPALEEAALAAGSGNFTTFRRITLPLMLPAIAGVFLLKLIHGIETFEVPAIIGIPAKIPVFASKIFIAVRRFPPDFGLATAYAVALLLLSVAGVFIYQRIVRESDRYATVGGKGFRPRVIDIGAWKYAACASIWAIFFVSLFMPLAVIVWSSFMPYYIAPSFGALARATLGNYRYVFNYPLAFIALKNSLMLSFGAATLVMLLTSAIAWIVVRSKMRGRVLLDVATFIPKSMPGAVLGVSLMLVYLTLPIPIYGTIWILLIAYLTKFMPHGMRFISASMVQIGKELEEASFASGATWGRTFRKITFPLLMPGFIGGWIYVGILSMRELSITVLLYSYGSTVLPVMAFELWEGGSYNYACVFGVLMILLSLLLALLARLFGTKIGIESSV